MRNRFTTVEKDFANATVEWMKLGGQMPQLALKVTYKSVTRGVIALLDDSVEYRSKTADVSVRLSDVRSVSVDKHMVGTHLVLRTEGESFTFNSIDNDTMLLLGRRIREMLP